MDCIFMRKEQKRGAETIAADKLVKYAELLIRIEGSKAIATQTQETSVSNLDVFKAKPIHIKKSSDDNIENVQTLDFARKKPQGS
jgi:hypothetical protein